MAKTEFKIKGMKRWRKALDARGFDRASRANFRRATALNGKVAERLERKVIQSSSSLKRNAVLTQAIKGGNKPLVDDSTLFQSITSKVIDDFTVFAGVLRTSQAYNVGILVHQGGEARVTPKMRGLFFTLWRASNGAIDTSKLRGRAKELFEQMQEGWLPLSDDTDVIVLPERPFARIAFRNTQLIKQARDNWKRALEMTFSERVK